MDIRESKISFNKDIQQFKITNRLDYYLQLTMYLQEKFYTAEYWEKKQGNTKEEAIINSNFLRKIINDFIKNPDIINNFDIFQWIITQPYIKDMYNEEDLFKYKNNILALIIPLKIITMSSKGEIFKNKKKENLDMSINIFQVELLRVMLIENYQLIKTKIEALYPNQKIIIKYNAKDNILKYYNIQKNNTITDCTDIAKQQFNYFYQYTDPIIINLCNKYIERKKNNINNPTPINNACINNLAEEYEIILDEIIGHLNSASNKEDLEIINLLQNEYNCSNCTNIDQEKKDLFKELLLYLLNNSDGKLINKINTEYTKNNEKIGEVIEDYKYFFMEKDKKGKELLGVIELFFSENFLNLVKNNNYLGNYSKYEIIKNAKNNEEFTEEILENLNLNNNLTGENLNIYNRFKDRIKNKINQENSILNTLLNNSQIKDKLEKKFNDNRYDEIQKNKQENLEKIKEKLNVKEKKIIDDTNNNSPEIQIPNNPVEEKNIPHSTKEKKDIFDKELLEESLKLGVFIILILLVISYRFIYPFTKTKKNKIKIQNSKKLDISYNKSIKLKPMVAAAA